MKNTFFSVAVYCYWHISRHVMTDVFMKKTETLSEEGRTLRMSGRISGINKWPDGYSVVVAGFSDESEYAVVTKQFRRSKMMRFR